MCSRQNVRETRPNKTREFGAHVCQAKQGKGEDAHHLRQSSPRPTMHSLSEHRIVSYCIVSLLYALHYCIAPFVPRNTAVETSSNNSLEESVKLQVEILRTGL